MKTYLTAGLITASLSIGGCHHKAKPIEQTQFPVHPDALTVPLTSTVNMLKTEMGKFYTAYNRRVAADDDDLKFRCGVAENGEEVVGQFPDVAFKSIVVELAVAQTTSGKFGVETVLASGPGFTLGADRQRKGTMNNTLTLNLFSDGSVPVPQVIAADDEPPGLAEALMQSIEQLAMTSSAPPCFTAGDDDNPSMVIKLSFGVERTTEREGGLNFVIFKVGGEQSKIKSYTHTLTANVNMSGDFMIVPAGR